MPMPSTSHATSLATTTLAIRRPTLLPMASVDTSLRCISSQSLMQGGRELLIRHQGSEYHLRLTRNDKLILTK